MIHEIPPRSGTAFKLSAGQRLKVIDPLGEQVSDLIAISGDDTGEIISSGRTIDYLSKIFLTAGDVIYSNRNRPTLTNLGDAVGLPDFPPHPVPRRYLSHHL